MPYDAQLPRQPSLLGVAELLPTEHLRRSDLRSASNLLSLLEDCHNYLYANEGLLKEKFLEKLSSCSPLSFTKSGMTTVQFYDSASLPMNTGLCLQVALKNL